MSKRILLTTALFASVLFLPWWVTVLVAVVLAFSATAYEIVIAGVALDALYGSSGASLYGVSLIFTGGALLLFVVAEYAKEHIKVGI